MLINNIVYVFLRRLLFRFLFLCLRFFAKDLPIVPLAVFPLLPKLLFDELIHFSLVILLRIVLCLGLLHCLLFLAFHLFLLSFLGLSTVRLFLVFPHLFKGLRSLLLNMRHMLSNSHFLCVLALASR